MFLHLDKTGTRDATALFAARNHNLSGASSFVPRFNVRPAGKLPHRTSDEVASEGQYSLTRILGIWATAAIPMALLAWVATPLVRDRFDLGVGDANREAFTRADFIMIGMVWQFVLAMIIIRHEEGHLSWKIIRRRTWLNAPRDPETGESRPKLRRWFASLIVGVVASQFIPLQALWEAAFPFLEEPGKYSFTELLQSDERKSALEGAWQILGLFVVMGIFNTVLGEELLFRGVLLPKMNGVFGKRDWVANGLLFGLYHLHQPWSILS
jgi:uncharacterized protein